MRECFSFCQKGDDSCRLGPPNIPVWMPFPLQRFSPSHTHTHTHQMYVHIQTLQFNRKNIQRRIQRRGDAEEHTEMLPHTMQN